LTVSADQKTFFATALPVTYGKTGKVSFYADVHGLHGEDLKVGRDCAFTHLPTKVTCSTLPACQA